MTLLLNHYLRERLALFDNRAFNWYFFDCLISNYGNGLTYLAMTWLLLEYQSGVGPVAILMACFWLPNLFLGPIVGVIADRCNRKYIILLANGLRALILFGFSWLLTQPMSAETRILSIYLLSFSQGSLFAITWPAAMTLIREIVPKERLLYANATIDSAHETGNLLGMGSMGLVVAITSMQATFMINAWCYVLATVSILLMPYAPQTKIIDHSKAMRSFIVGIVADWWLSIVYIWHRKPLCLLYCAQLLLFVSYMTAPILLATFAKERLHTTVGEFGLIEAALSIGTLAGGLISPFFINRWRLSFVLYTQMIVLAGAYYSFSINHRLWVADLCYFLIGFCFSAWAFVVTHAQHLTDIQFQARLQATFNSLASVFVMLIYAMLYSQRTQISLEQVYLVEVIFAVLTLGCLWLAFRLEIK